ncbi:alpha-amylase [Pacificimonas flava]|uniref:Alpha-amylase n=2 Tax=Pacificimonas TaxID=1960290 RepID=A0A219B1I9_9SPHN|nr:MULTISPECIES: alpha-amylase [Pacificimonas]MBZ6378144.1 transporter [Pacificimonas aurantium]OWV32222.1 alpha-amylase [Pacificimonas flava]
MKTSFPVAALAAALLPCAAFAHDVSALDHAPIGVMGDHRHAAGELMFSYRLMHMEMSGVQVGTGDISADTVATTIPNRFSGMAGQPPTLRIVPKSMRMDMHMLGGMYGLSDRVTLMGMANYVTREMDLITYQGGMGTAVLGDFGTAPGGFGDTSLTALIGLGETVHLNAGISIPTGPITKSGDVLTPMGMRQEMRLPYPMQLGSGTWDLLPGITYTDRTGPFGWGGQVKGTLRLGENDENYHLGDTVTGTAWAAYALDPAVSVSLRAEGESVGRIEGIDPAIMGPVQTANPDFSGGERVTAFAGLNLVATHGPLAAWRLGLEAGMPVVQDLNGPQMPRDWSLTLGIQKGW